MQSVFFKDGHPEDTGEIEGNFRTADGRSLPVLSRYRQAIVGRPGYWPIAVLEGLRDRGVTGATHKSLLDSVYANRTLPVSFNELVDVARTAVSAHGSHFLPESLEPPRIPRFIPSRAEIVAGVKSAGSSYSVWMERIRQLGLLGNRRTVLEVGPDESGYSVMALSELGFTPTGLNNGYAGIVDSFPEFDYVRRITGHRLRMVLGDITARDTLADESFDLIVSHTVLEHILDIPASLETMHRLLKPGGLMFHLYNPWWAVNGGHTPGILDCPWGHVRMSFTDLHRYFEEFRPNELPVFEDSFNVVLNRRYPIAEMQRLIVAAGFDIQYWEELPPARSLLQQLSPRVQSDAFSMYPQIGLADLTSQNVAFVATRK